MKQLTRIFLSIILLLGACDQLLFAQEMKTKEDICKEELLALYKAYFEENFFDERYRKAKLFLEKVDKPGCDLGEGFIAPNVRTFVKRRELVQLYNKCADADKTYFTSPNLPNLNSMISACSAWIEKAPTPDHYYSTRLAIAAGHGLIAGFNKDIDQTFSLTEKALEGLKEETLPRDWTEKNWLQFRRENIGRLLQYQGLCKLRQSQADTEKGIGFLTKAAALKNGPAYRDTNTYLLRAEAYISSCPKIKEAIDAKNTKLQPNEKSLLEVCPVVEKVIHDYARVVALYAVLPIQKIQDDDTQEVLTRLWGFTYPNSSHKKLDDLINFYKAEFSRR
jgi:hypothetical protein